MSARVQRLGKSRLVVIGVGLSIVFWFLEALLHVLVFNDTDLTAQIISPQLHEVWMRLTVMGMFIAFGIYSHRMVEARRRAEEAARLARSGWNTMRRKSARMGSRSLAW